jgi:NADPH:quinone reductase-like Zn-dependent oxidoreductase
MEQAKHRRVVVPRRGGPEVLQVVEEELPEPRAGEVRVKLLAAGVSAYDSRTLTEPWGRGAGVLQPGRVGVAEVVGAVQPGLEPRTWCSMALGLVMCSARAASR